MQYKELEQQKLREENILNSLQQANECGKNCEYSEEDILKAQCKPGMKGINCIYDGVINPNCNAVIYFICTLITLVLMPLLYVDNGKEVKATWVTAYVLIWVILIIMKVVTSSVKKNTEKNREWIKYFNQFSNDTYAFGYILTSLGYLMIILDSGTFWYIYAGMIAVFSAAIFFDLVKPLVTYLRLDFCNRKFSKRK